MHTVAGKGAYLNGRRHTMSAALPWGLGLSLTPLCVLLSLPDTCGAVFAGTGSAIFAGVFLASAAAMYGALGCIPVLRGRRFRLLTWLQVTALVVVAVAAVLGAPVPLPVGGAVFAGLALGVGHARTLVSWVPAGCSLGARELAVAACASFAVVAAVSLPLAWLPPSWTAVAWGWLALAATAASALVTVAAPLEDSGETPVAASERSRATGLWAVWEPVAGLALSLISLALPWGAALDGDQSSVPPLGAVALGWLGVAAAAVVIGRHVSGRRLSLGLAANVGVPVLAALVVVLWMVGDVSTLPLWAVVLKGVGSGIACGSFFVLAWVTLVYGRGEASTERTLGWGLACAYVAAAAIFGVHALFGQRIAGGVSPVGSIAFLLVACIASTIRLARLSADDARSLAAAVAPGPTVIDTPESAVAAMTADYGLSPREAEVLGHVVRGRTAEGIADVMQISPHTVRAHVRKIHEKLKVSSRDQIAQLVEERRQR